MVHVFKNVSHRDFFQLLLTLRDSSLYQQLLTLPLTKVLSKTVKRFFCASKTATEFKRPTILVVEIEKEKRK